MQGNVIRILKVKHCYNMELENAEPKFKRIVRDFQHFLLIREDNHKFIEHLFMERLKVEAELLERLENEIEQLKSLTLRSCPNCGIMRPKRYHRGTQTPRQRPSNAPVVTLLNDENDVEERLQRLTDQVDKVSKKTTGMLSRSFQLQYNSHQLKNQVEKMSLI